MYKTQKSGIDLVKEQVGVQALPAPLSAPPLCTCLHPPRSKQEKHRTHMHICVQLYICRISKVSSLTKMSSKFFHGLTQTP